MKKKKRRLTKRITKEKTITMQMNYTRGNADLAIPQGSQEPQLLPVASSKRLPEVDLTALEDLTQRRHKRRRLSKHQDPTGQQIESCNANFPMPQGYQEPQLLPVANSKRPPEADLTALEDLTQRGNKRRRISEHQDPTGQQLNSFDLWNVVKTWLEQFEKRIYDAIKLSNPRLERQQPTSFQVGLIFKIFCWLKILTWRGLPMSPLRII